MQTVVVIADEKSEKLRELVQSFVSVKRYFIYLPLVECYSEIGLLTIESADIVLVAADSIDSAKRLFKGYPSKKLNKTLCICPRKNLLTAWTLKNLFNHAIVCRQGELYHSIKGMLEILAQKDVIDLEVGDILSFCTGEVAEIYYCETEKELITEKLLDMRNFNRKSQQDVLLYVNGAVTLSDVETVANICRRNDENIVIGVGYREGTSVMKVCSLIKSC